MPKLKELFAFVATDNGLEDEGIVSIHQWNEVNGIATLESLPLVGGTRSLIEKLVPLAEAECRKHNKTFKVLHYKLVGEIPVDKIDVK